jgi:ABC-type transporter Mla subunit MlaD
MVLSLPRPSTLVDFAISAAGNAVGAAMAVASAPARLMRLVDDVEVLVIRATTVVDAAEQAVVEVQAVTASAAGIVQESARTSAAAGAAVEQAAQSARTASELIAAYEPAARRFVEELSAEEIDAAIRMIDEMPRLAHHLNADVLPILATLDRVGPDIHELLGVTRDLRQAILGIPGFGMLRRRGEEKDAD